MASSTSSTKSYRNSSQHNASSGVHIIESEQSMTSPPKQATPIKTSSSQNVPYCRICLNSTHVPTQFRAITADVRDRLIGRQDVSFTRWAPSPSCGQSHRRFNRPWSRTCTPMSVQTLKSQRSENASKPPLQNQPPVSQQTAAPNNEN